MGGRAVEKAALPGGEIVESHHVVAVGEQAIDEVAADESGGAGD
jgi:hypothetical protein